MGNSEEDVLKLVGMTYDAALDERKWPTFLEALTSAVGGSSAFLRSVDYQAIHSNFIAHIGFDPAVQAEYANYYINLDYYSKFWQAAPLNITSTDQDGERWGISPSYQRKTEYYNDFVRRMGIEYAMGTVLARDDNRTLHLATQRTKSAGEFGEDQVRLVSALSPHVTRAVQVHRKLSNITLEKEWALGALDQLRLGVILTNERGTPIFANCTAEQILTKGDGINTQHGRLILTAPTETAKLYTLIENAAKGLPGTNQGGDMRIRLNSGYFLHCTVMPIPIEFTTRWNIPLASGCVALLLSEPGGLQLSPQRLAALYGLTLAEGKLAAKLAEPKSLEQAADDLAISLHTVRSQLKSIFAKTGAQTQSGLLLLLTTGSLANIRSEPSK